jgi:hypothetical protein
MPSSRTITVVVFIGVLFLYLFDNGCATGFPLLTQAPPVVTKALLLPGDHRAWPDKCQGIGPARPEPRQPHPA